MTERDTLFEQRLRKVAELRAEGVDPYANDFKVDTSIARFVATYKDLPQESPAPADTAQRHAIAGRVMAINSFGKAAFIRLQDASADARDSPRNGVKPFR